MLIKRSIYRTSKIYFKPERLKNERNLKSDKEHNNNTSPWPISPNIKPNIYGKEINVKTPGLASLYFGMPYVSTIY